MDHGPWREILADHLREVGGSLLVRPSPDASAFVLRLAGRLDGSTAQALHQAVDGVPAGTAVVVDLTRLRACDAAGLHVLTGLQRRLQADGGELVLRAREGDLHRVLRRLGVASSFTLRDLVLERA